MGRKENVQWSMLFVLAIRVSMGFGATLVKELRKIGDGGRGKGEGERERTETLAAIASLLMGGAQRFEHVVICMIMCAFSWVHHHLALANYSHILFSFTKQLCFLMRKVLAKGHRADFYHISTSPS